MHVARPRGPGTARPVRCFQARSSRMKEGGRARALVESNRSHVLPLELARPMPVIARGHGVWLEDAAGRRYLDAMSGGSMAATLGHGRRDIIAAARAQAESLAYVHNERHTNPAQERLPPEPIRGGPEGFTR